MRNGEEGEDMRVNNSWLLDWSMFKVLGKRSYSAAKVTGQSLQSLVKFVISREILREQNRVL